MLALFEADPETEATVLIGEIGGTKEQEAAEFIRSGGYTKPLVFLIVGQSAPPGKRMGHAGAIITGTAALASEKTRALEVVGGVAAPTAGEIGSTMSMVLGNKT
jgi:succinyl-CoA synthetase alpha subunit